MPKTMAVMFEFDASDRRKFSNLIGEMSKMTGRELPVVVRNVGRDFVKQAIRLTPVAEETRLIRARPHIKSDGKLSHWYPVIPPEQERIKGRGYAKIGWVKALWGLGMFSWAGVRKYIGKGVKDHGVFINGLKRPSPFVIIGNNTPYLGLLDTGGGGNRAHHIMRRAKMRTQRQMERTLTRLSRKMRSKWR